MEKYITTAQNLGKTEGQLLIERMKADSSSSLSGSGYINYVKQATEQIEKFKEAQKNKAGITGILEGLEKEVGHFNKDKFDGIIFDLKNLGMGKEGLSEAENIVRQMRLMEQKPFKPTPKLEAFDMGMMTGWAATSRTIDYDEQVAKNTQDHTKLLQEIKVLLGKNNKQETGSSQTIIVSDL
jgi:hypothetical protein